MSARSACSTKPWRMYRTRTYLPMLPALPSAARKDNHHAYTTLMLSTSPSDYRCRVGTYYFAPEAEGAS